MEAALYTMNLLLIPALSPLAIGIIRKLKAILQGRIGASMLQPYRDLAKLFRKNEVISEDASWIFLIAPYIVFCTTLALAAGVPLFGMTMAAPTSDILVFVYLLATGTFFLALAGFDTGGAFGGFGASREMMIAALAEGGLILSLLAAALLSASSNLVVMASMLSHLPTVSLAPLTLAAAAFFIALLAENSRYPVDNPATHLELTMVHEAMILEYSGKRLALMEWAAANKLAIFVAVFANIFIPWGQPDTLSVQAIFLSIGVFLLKALMCLASIAFIESTMSKLRIFRVPDLLFTSFVLSIISILIIVL